MKKLFFLLVLVSLSNGSAYALSCNSNFGSIEKNVRFEISNTLYYTLASRLFLDSLEEQKSNLMNLYKIDNNLYNKLSCYAFAIMGNESSFAKTFSEEHLLEIFNIKNITNFKYLKMKLQSEKRILKYATKENFPSLVAYIKSWKNDTLKKSIQLYQHLKNSKGEGNSFAIATLAYLIKKVQLDLKFIKGKLSVTNNSRGPTQIKRVPKKISNFYGISKSDLHNPKFSAIATFGFLAQSLKQLRAYHINKNDYLNYIHYIYMGSSSQIRRGTATPEKNIYLRNLRVYMRGLKVYQDTLI